MELFHDTKIKFEKLAMETELSDNAEQWQQECASELYRQVPYVSNYATDVILDKVDAERGYAYGKATLRNRYDIPQPEKDSRAVNIPIIVRDKMLKPFDMYTYESKSFPISEQRLSQSLFKNQPLELTDRKPTDKMLSTQMAPPTRSHLNSQVSSGGFGKYASGESLLDEVLPTISKKEQEDFLSKIANNLGLQQAFLDNNSFRNAVVKIASVTPGIVKKASEMLGEVPTCVQLKKISHNTFVIKTANLFAFDPVERELDTRQVADQLLGDQAYKMAPGEVLTGSSMGPINTTEKTEFKSATSPGTYQVRDNTGRDTYGAVLPMVNFSGNNTGESIFIAPEGYSIQEKIAGKKIANEMALPEAIPSGYGVFHDPENNVVTEPVNISHMATERDHFGEFQSRYKAQDNEGKKVTITQIPSFKKMAKITDNWYGVPPTMKWVPLSNNELNIQSENKDNVADFKNLDSTIEIRSTGDDYSISGRPVEKIGNTQFLSRDNAEFILGAMGISSEKLAEAAKKKYVKVAGARHIIPASEANNIHERELTKFASKFPWYLKKDFTKEAAVLTDEDTVDKVLSLGFLNKDNLRNFAGYLPELEKTTNKLADLLFASRCGLSTVPEEAIESAMKNTDHILSGLRTLQEQEMM